MPDGSTSFADHCREIARRFLLTAAVVDDELSVVGRPMVRGELSVAGSPTVHGGLTKPGRLPLGGLPKEPVPEPKQRQDDRPHPLNLNPVTWSFARQGMVCGMISPSGKEDDERHLARAVARADIVILDWRLNRDTGANALPLLHRILKEDQRNRLRLIAFYTGEAAAVRERIRDQIEESLQDLVSPKRTTSRSESDPSMIDFGACRIVAYGKPGGVHEDGLDDVISEDQLADRLIDDFAHMVQGLLPSLVITALTAVRENVYRVLECFGTRLDPAFLAHRACLDAPSESEQHIVEQLASELGGIMDDAVGRECPAGIEAIEKWLQERFEDREVVFGRGKEASRSQVLAMLTHGVKRERGPLRAQGKDYDILSYGFSGCADDSEELDRALASRMNFRQVHADRPPRLSMGTVVRQIGSEEGNVLLCATPKCDSVRLKERSSFLFLPLSSPPQSKTSQIVVPSVKSRHERLTLEMNPAQWRILDFNPDPDAECVLASTDDDAGSRFLFKDRSENRYQWVGELKADVAQSVAQAIATRMARVGLNKSEWHRRSEGLE